MMSIYEEMNKIDDNASLQEGLFDSKAKKEAAYKEAINNVFGKSEFRNPAVSFGRLVNECLNDWRKQLPSGHSQEQRINAGNNYITQSIKQCETILSKLKKSNRDTVLEIFRMLRNLKFNPGEERPNSFDDLDTFYKLYINALGKEQDGYKVQEYLAPSMCDNAKRYIEVTIKYLKSKN